MAKPQIGVVVPTLNSAATLVWTLCALRSQRQTRLEVVVADSGSEDGTLEICKKWGMGVIYVPPGNMYRAINTGLREMKAEWVTYLNSDDLVYPESYARLLALGEQRHASAAYGDCDFIDEEGRFLFAMKSPSPNRLRGLLERGTAGFAQPAAIFRGSAFRELGGFDERYRHIADYDFFYRLTLSGHRLVKLERPAVAAFRIHASQLSTREAGIGKNELRSFQNMMRVKESTGGALDVLRWRIQNTPNYLWRAMRQRP